VSSLRAVRRAARLLGRLGAPTGGIGRAPQRGSRARNGDERDRACSKARARPSCRKNNCSPIFLLNEAMRPAKRGGTVKRLRFLAHRQGDPDDDLIAAQIWRT
jgi:hypothetical protein